MPDPNFILLYVGSPARSASFYARILGCDPIEASASFVLFKLDSGCMLGLWGRSGVEPQATKPGGGELAFALDDDLAVDRLHAEWSGLGIPVIQPPVRMDFGYTFTATDPDGHRLRAFCPS